MRNKSLIIGLSLCAVPTVVSTLYAFDALHYDFIDKILPLTWFTAFLGIAFIMSSKLWKE